LLFSILGLLGWYKHLCHGVQGLEDRGVAGRAFLIIRSRGLGIIRISRFGARKSREITFFAHKCLRTFIWGKRRDLGANLGGSRGRVGRGCRNSRGRGRVRGLIKSR
jgi:hypothetical protein